MKKISISFALLVLCFTAGAQMVGTNVFIRGSYLEVGINNIGSLGAGTTTPAGYHPHPSANIASVYDYGHDGWSTGSPPFMGDYTYTGSPFEGWALQVGSERVQAFTSVTSPSYTSAGITVIGGTAGYTSAGGVAKAYWSGTAVSSTGTLAIDMVSDVGMLSSAVRFTVKMRNTGTTATAPIYYMRNCDPDIDMAWPAGAYITSNTIVYQNDIMGRSLVQANSVGVPGMSLGLGARDSRARVFQYTSWPMSIGTDLAGVFSGPPLVGSTITGDFAIGLIYNLGSIPVGDSVVFSYAYIYNGTAGFGEVFPDTCTGTPFAGTVTANTPVACSTTGVILSLSGTTLASGLAYQWQSSSDSVSWTDVSGATTGVYSFSGLTADTWYRCLVTCTSAIATDVTPGYRIAHSAACPCLDNNAGVVVPSVTSACSTATFMLNNTGYAGFPTIALQWQSSPDSVVWADIPGATTVPYSISGLTATTYYRLKTTCIATGDELFSAGSKITYTATCICTGTPVPGIAISSTDTCSACSLTLSLTAISPVSGLSYQWERSLSGAGGWMAISGATDTTYTHSPGDTYYYRCETSCSFSSLVAYSNQLLVTMMHSIVADSVMASPDTTCSGQLFYVRLNSNSPLLRIKTFFGDGTSATSVTLPGATGRYANIPHNYTSPGTYTVTHILYQDTVYMDTLVFTYTHPVCNTFRIRFFLDENTDCIRQSAEVGNMNPLHIQLDSNGVSIDTLTALSGLYYKTLAPAGTVYRFSLLPGSMLPTCPASADIYDTVTVGGNLNRPVRNVALTCSSADYDMAQYTNTICDITRLTTTIIIQNLRCMPQNADEVFSFSSKYAAGVVLGTYMLPVTPSYTTNSITWLSTGLSAITGTRVLKARVNKNPSETLIIGDTIHSSGFISPIVLDDDPTNNNSDDVDTIRASYDPNMIEVTPSGCFDIDTVLQYIVHFENMGNDTAHNVYVLDTLSPNLNYSSLEILAATAEMDIFEYKEGPYHIVKFDFPGIKLLDSSWHGLNDGMFVFKIRTLPGLATGAVISNRVGIYFDGNDVVMTNTVENIKGCPETLTTNIPDRANVRIYPNPATDELTIQTTGADFASYVVTNAIGQHLLEGKLSSGGKEVISVRDLPPGIYHITLRGSGTEVRKFVKW